MPTDERTLTHGGTTDAAWRAWGLGVREALIACGLVKTTDTGQIDFATATRPVANSTSGGYDVFRFDDDLQATHPVHIKVDYRTTDGGSSGNVFTIRLTVGLGGTNGAGGMNVPNFVSAGLTAFDLSTANTGGATVVYTSGDAEEGRIWWYRHSSLTTVSANTQGFFIERSRNSQGESVPVGVLFGYWANSAQVSAHFLSFTNSLKNMGQIEFLAMDMGGMPSTAGGDNLAVAPFMYCVAGEWYEMALLYGLGTDFTPLSPVLIERFGEEQGYVTFQTGMSTTHAFNLHDDGTILVRFD